jgi:hypothetical protein
MAEERDDEQTKETEGKSGQQPTGEQGQQPIAGQQGQQPGEGFIGSQATGSDETHSETLDRSDFASEGQGATEAGNENIETGQRQDSESDIEGSSGNS